MKSLSQIEYFKEDDVLWVNIKDGVEYNSVEIAPSITVELGKNNEIIGIEILNASRHFNKEVIKRLKHKGRVREEK